MLPLSFLQEMFCLFPAHLEELQNAYTPKVVLPFSHGQSEYVVPAQH